MISTKPTASPSTTSAPTSSPTRTDVPAFLKGLLTYVRELFLTDDGEMLLLATQRLLFYTVCAAFVALVGALTSIWVLLVIALFTFFGK